MYDQRRFARLEALGGWFGTGELAAPGETLLCSADGDVGALWILVPRDRPRAQGVGPVADSLWKDATAAAAEHAPVNLLCGRPSDDVRVLRLPHECIGPRSNSPVIAPEWADGSSLGGALFLSVLSLQLDAPIPTDFVCSISLSRHHASLNLSAVGGLVAKTAAVAAFARGVTRILIHKSQPAADVEDAQAVAQRLGAALEFVRIDSFDHLIHEAWNIESDASLVDTLMTNALEDLPPSVAVDHLAWSVLEARRTTSNWRPVQAAITWLKHAIGHDPRRDLELNLVCQIVERHANNRGGLEPLTDHQKALFPADFVSGYTAHLVQQCSDCGIPSVDDAVRLGEAELPQRWWEDGTATEQGLRVAGALGRLYGRRGEWELAWDYEYHAYLGWARRAEWGQAAYPLCILYRYAGLLRNEEKWNTAESLAKALALRGSLNAFLRLERGRALVMFGRYEQAIDELFGGRNAIAQPSTRVGFERWIRRAAIAQALAEGTGHAEECAARARYIQDWDDPSRTVLKNHSVRRTLALMKLDHGTEGAIDELVALEPAIMAHLEFAWEQHGAASVASTRETDWRQFVADAFPY